MQKVFLLIEMQNHFQDVRLITSEKKVAEAWVAPAEHDTSDNWSPNRYYQEMEVYGELPLPPRP